MRTATIVVLVLALRCAGANADPPGPHFRCGCGRREVAFVVDSIAPAPPPAAHGTAMDAVVAMFDAFERRSLADYTRWLAPDFVFESTDSTVRAEHPHGMLLDDELAFARNLFRDDATPGNGGLPHAQRVRVTRRLMRAAATRPGDTKAWIIIEGLRAQIDLSDGTLFDTGETHHELLLVSTEAGWRVRRWLESYPDDSAPVADTTAIASQAVDSAVTTTRTPAGVALPTRLDLYTLMDPAHHSLVFQAALPRAGGVLEMFDVQGRRVERRDLGDLRPGYHRISLEGGSFAAGVYWARLRQESATATTKVIWAR